MKKKLLILSLLTLSKTCFAATTIVADHEVRTIPIVLPGIGDIALIQEFGRLLPFNSLISILIGNEGQQVINNGQIINTRSGSTGIATGVGGFDNLFILNNGRIVVVGVNNIGIQTNGGSGLVITNNGYLESSSIGIETGTATNAIVTNNGAIFLNQFGVGISLFLSNNSIVRNNGIINGSSVNGNSVGISSINNTDIILTNNGTIDLGSGSIGFAGSFGILSAADTNGLIENNGTISVTSQAGNDSFGILVDSGMNMVVTNTGNIFAFHSNQGVVEHSTNTTIINSGTIKADQANAITLGGTGSTLVLLRGSNIQGGVEFDNPVTLVVERGLNLALTLNPASVGFSTLNIDAPFVIVGNTLAVLDPTGLGLQADVTADLSDTILDGIYRRRSFCCPCNPCGCEVWVEGIGSFRKRSHHKNVGYRNSQGGFIIGVNNQMCNGEVGAFGAVTFGDAHIDANTQRARIRNYVGGLTYETFWCNTFFGLAVAAGYVNWDNTRIVMDNLSLNGIGVAEYKKGGAFVSPELTVAHYFSSIYCHPILSFTFRYAGLFLGDCREHGSLTPLAVKDREVDLLTTRLELSVPFTDRACGWCFSVEPYLGVYGRYQVGGNDVKGFFFEQPIAFAVGNPENLAALLLGCRGIQSYKQLDLFLNFEVSFDTARSSRVLGEGGIAYRF